MEIEIHRLLFLRRLLLLLFLCQASATRIPYRSTDSPRQGEFRVVYFATPNSNVPTILYAGPARFGAELTGRNPVESTVELVQPQDGCTDLTNNDTFRGKIAIVHRGNCQFAEKAIYIQNAGGVGGIVIDYNPGLSAQGFPVFVMGSGTVTQRVTIPMVFLYSTEGEQLLNASSRYPNLMVGISGSLPASVPRTEELTTEASTTELLTENSPRRDFSVSAEEQQQKPREETNKGGGIAEQLSTVHIALICAGILLLAALVTISGVCWRRSSRKKSGGSPDEIQFSRLDK